MNAPVFPDNPTIGQRYMNWVFNGVRWVCNPMAGMQVIQTVFTASGLYQPSPGLVTVVVEAIGGGGGGGGAEGDQTSTAVPGWIMGGGGGSSGGYSRSALAAGLVLGGVQITIGQGGAAGSGNPPFNAGNGSPTSFGAFVIAEGGIGGGSGVAGNQFGNGGPQPQPGIGQIASPGNGGGSGIAHYWDPAISGGSALGGAGGGSFLGGAGTNVTVTSGNAAPGQIGQLGAGGSGAASGLLADPELGGVGGGGVCIVTEYCWMDVIDEDCGCGSTTGMARVALHSGGGRNYRGYPHVEPYDD